ncbi:tRNA dihydrouridine synthase DusB [Stenoxybacter acetivorans]|uniref:tRNA dihydrouridine synthase DusB n=1 Tax=Stenoxybacter acetivorans TaxID=422441 RepID=UPI0006892918|nr:tRNA dihydrouridine synthase DusB [Stenoxybacter acetivorans]
MHIGLHTVNPPLALAPMAGITDKPFRQLCRELGAGWVVGEMLSSDPALQHTRKSLHRTDRSDENGVIVAQIAGSNPQQMAAAARFNAANGAQVIDINMGCPVKKVCGTLAGSALLRDERLVEAILRAVVSAVDVPVTLKTRLGWDEQQQNLPAIAEIAEASGIAALAVHGRTRADMYRGEARYDLIAEVKRRLRIPLWVNGDLDSPQKAMQVQRQTGADGVMIGRGAQGQPWLFRDLAHYYQHGRLPEALSPSEHANIIIRHITAMHDFYGGFIGTRTARKHIGWYVQHLPEGEAFRRRINQTDDAYSQLRQLTAFLDSQVHRLKTWPCAYRGLL